MNSPTDNTIPSTDFGQFSPQPSAPLAIKDGELLAMAGGVVKGLWQIPPEVFTELPKRLNELAMGQNPRSATKAAKLLIEMNKSNDSPEQFDQAGNVTIYIPHNGRDPLPSEPGGES